MSDYEVSTWTGAAKDRQVLSVHGTERAAIDAAIAFGRPTGPSQPPYDIRTTGQTADRPAGDLCAQVTWDHDGVVHVGRHGPPKPVRHTA
jgi:hypothetical protein